MARRLPKDVDWIEVVLEVEDPWCGECGRRMHVLRIAAIAFSR